MPLYLSLLFRNVDKKELLLDLEIKRAKLEIEVLEEQSINNKLWEKVLVGQLENQVTFEVISSNSVS